MPDARFAESRPYRVRFVDVGVARKTWEASLANLSIGQLCAEFRRHHQPQSRRWVGVDFHRDGTIVSNGRVIGRVEVLEPALMGLGERPEQPAPKMPAQSDGRCYLCREPLSAKPAHHGTHDECAREAAREG